MSVDKIFDNIIKTEGGYVNDPDDKGGPTKYGIAWNYNSDLLKKMGYKKPEDVKKLKKEDAKEIYKKKYFYDPGFDKLPIDIQEHVTDIGVNSGPSTAKKMLSQAQKEAGTRDLNDILANIRRQRYHDIVTRRPSQEKFLEGWTRRANEYDTGVPTPKRKPVSLPTTPQRKPEPVKSMNSFERLIIEVLKGM